MPTGVASILPALTLLVSYPDDLAASVILACCSLGADSTCDFTSSIWTLATGIARLMLYEPISSQIDWPVGLEKGSFEDLAFTFADGLVPTTHKAVFSHSRSPFFQPKDPYAGVRMLYQAQTQIS